MVGNVQTFEDRAFAVRMRSIDCWPPNRFEPSAYDMFDVRGACTIADRFDGYIWQWTAVVFACRAVYVYECAISCAHERRVRYSCGHINDICDIFSVVCELFISIDYLERRRSAKMIQYELYDKRIISFLFLKGKARYILSIHGHQIN